MVAGIVVISHRDSVDLAIDIVLGVEMKIKSVLWQYNYSLKALDVAFWIYYIFRYCMAEMGKL